jgi:hypothetical protein
VDWVPFLEQNNIHYRTSGPGVSKANIAIHCPWCGIADKSQHLSVNLEGLGFRCWRQPNTHSGKNPAKLIQALLNCSWNQANNLAGQARTIPDDFLSKVRASMSKKEVIQPRNKLKLPSEFKTFFNKPSAKPYVEYLRRRGYNDKQIQQAKNYGIYYASQGLYKGRIIFTVTDNGDLVGWTGRTIYPNEIVRYQTLTNDLEKAEERGETPAPHPVTNFLLFADRLLQADADTIVLTEGPFDAWKVNVLGEIEGIVSTCFFTSSMSVEQKNKLYEILPRFKRKYILLDQGTFSRAERIRNDLVSFGVEVRRMPESIDDPGNIPTTNILKKVLAIV